MAVKRTSKKIGTNSSGKSNIRTTNVNNATGRITTSLSQGFSGGRYTQNSNGEVFLTKRDAGGWFSRKKLNKKPLTRGRKKEEKLTVGNVVAIVIFIAALIYLS